MKRIICALILCALMLSLISCSTPRNDIDELFSQLAVSDLYGDETDVAEHIYVIIPKGCSGELSLKARELADAISAKTGIVTSLKYDGEFSHAPSGSLEILLGDTNRLASSNAVDILKDGDYICRWDNGAVVICGKSDSATVLAVERFMSDVLPGMTNSYIMSEYACIENIAEYEISKIILQGYDLYDYAIVYNEGNADEQSIALALQSFLSAKSGYLLSVTSKPNSVTRKIVLSSRSEETAIISNDSGIILCGDDSYSLSCAVSAFVKDIKSNSQGGTVNLSYGENTFITDNESAVSAVFYTVKNKSNDITPINELLLSLGKTDFGFCIVGNSSDIISEGLANTFKTYHKTITLSVGERSVSLIYDTRRLANLNAVVNTEINAIDVSFESEYGEKMRVLYALNSDVYALSGVLKQSSNTFVLAEGYNGEVSSDIINVAFSGSGAEFDYLLAVGENSCIKTQEPTVVNDEYRFSLKAELGARYSFEFLNDALK